MVNYLPLTIKITKQTKKKLLRCIKFNFFARNETAIHKYWQCEKELHYRYLSELCIVYVAEKEIEALESLYNFISLRKCWSPRSVKD